jgi:enamine deaminase RidA (YjgF/YER057c/UK114 family)
MIEVSRFTEPDALIEIEAVAAVPSDTPRGSGVA